MFASPKEAFGIQEWFLFFVLSPRLSFVSTFLFMFHQKQREFVSFILSTTEINGLFRRNFGRVSYFPW
jgi:hypothetical protein